jgi:hypothetical protein
MSLKPIFTFGHTAFSAATATHNDATMVTINNPIIHLAKLRDTFTSFLFRFQISRLMTKNLFPQVLLTNHLLRQILVAKWG